MINRSQLVDILRIVGLVMVVVSHIISMTLNIPQGFGIPGFYYVNIGGWGVSLFIFLSGYVLFSKYRDRIDVKKFYRTRILRIYITYWICLLIVVLVAFQAEFLFSDPLHFFCGMTASCVVFNILRSGPNQVAWFITAIVAQYFLFPLYRKVLLWNKYVFLWIAVFSATIVRLTLQDVDWAWHLEYWIPASRILEFGLGMFLAYHFPMKNERKAGGILSFIAIMTYPMYLLHLDLLTYYDVQGLPLFIMLSALAVIITQRFDKPRQLVDKPSE